MPMPFQEATPAEVKARFDRGEVTLIDVREPEEVLIAHIEGAQLYPMSQAAGWINDLPQDQELVIFCHHGGRSAQVAQALAQRGHTKLTNMSGGIDLWSETVDPTVPRY